MYVQDLLKQQSQQICKLVESNAHIYVCGSTAMGREVLDTFKSIWSSYKSISLQEASNYFLILQKQNQYVQEVWST